MFDYSRAREEEPTNPRWPYFLGLLDMSVGDSASALSIF